jgi:hypothetical protein
LVSLEEVDAVPARNENELASRRGKDAQLPLADLFRQSV